MDVMEAIKKRRSIRRYKPDPVPDEVLDPLLESLRLAPSGSNRQAWKFIIVRDAVMREKLAQAFRYGTPRAKVRPQMWVAQAPVIIVACGLEREATAGILKDGEPFLAKADTLFDSDGNPTWSFNAVHYDLAIALDHFSLAAMEAGLGTCWIGGLHQLEVKQLLGVPDDVTAELAMTVGYAEGDWPKPRPRKTREDVIAFDKY